MLAFIYSTGEYSHDKTYPYMTLKVTSRETKFIYFHFFGLLWNIAFITQVCNFIITGVVCIWYHQNQDDGGSPISVSVKWAFFNHIGTIAFGSLILAIVWIIRIIAEYIAVSSI